DLGLGWETETRRPTAEELGVRQPLYRGGRTEAGVARAQNQVMAQRALLIDSEQSVLLDAVTAYMDVWSDEAEVRLNINNEEVIRRHLAAARDRFEVGETTRTDVAQAESRLARATAQRIAAEAQLRTSRAIFREVTGIPAGSLPAAEAASDIPESEERVTELAQRFHPRVVSSNFRETASEREVRERYGELLPEVRLRAAATAEQEYPSRATRMSAARIIAEVSMQIDQLRLITSRDCKARAIHRL